MCFEMHYVKLIINCGYCLVLGESCELDKDGCADGPCSSAQNCTDLTPAEEQARGIAFECSECPDGYDDVNGICVGKLDTMLNYLELSPRVAKLTKSQSNYQT